MISVNRRFVPSMAALLTFEAVARYNSITLAADELGRTQGAVSRQVTLLEERLGIRLFFRERNRLVLSQQGEQYAKQIRAVLNDLADHTAAVVAGGTNHDVLNVAVLPTFCSRWLVPRMSRFYECYSNIEVNFLSETRPFDFNEGDADVAIHYGQRSWPDAVVRPLLTEVMTVVCSPELLKKSGVCRPLDLKNCRLLQHLTRPDAWQWWFDAIEQDFAHPMVGPQFELFSHVIDTAVAGLGFAILPKFLIGDELENGILVAPFAKEIAGYGSYYVVFPCDKADRPAVRAYCDWLRDEAVRFSRNRNIPIAGHRSYTVVSTSDAGAAA